MKTHKFARKPFYVDAVRVSETNMAAVAEWCDGEIKTDEEDGDYIKVKVHRPLTEKQTQAFLGDWVLWAGTGFKVYTPKAFDKSFEKVRTLSKAQADEAGIKVPHEPKSSTKGFRKPPTIADIATIRSVSVVAEEPNPAVGVHPIEKLADTRLPGCACTLEEHVSGEYNDNCPICGAMGIVEGEGADVPENKPEPTVIPPKNDPVSKLFREVGQGS